MDNFENFAYVPHKDDLQVLMLGGRRCGKTAVLASMFHAVKHGIANEYLTFTDQTELKTHGVETQDSLSEKTAELLDLLSHPNTATFLIDQRPSNYWWDYRMKIQIRGTDRAFYMNFRDVPGEYCRKGKEGHEAEMRDYIKKCAVFVVVIDTPYLMESANPLNSLCTDGTNMAVNRTEEILDFIGSVGDGHMVVFCPAKCEKWYNSGRIGEVNERIKKVYGSLITGLTGKDSKHKNDISIIPVLTAGNIEFVEQKEAFILNDNRENFKLNRLRNGLGLIRCCMQTDTLLRLWDGSPYTKKESDAVKPDSEAALIKSDNESETVSTGSELVRPYSWFKTCFHSDPTLNGYHPVNCEQLVLHITRYMLAKHERERNIFQYLIAIFRGIDPQELKKIIDKMQIEGIIKDKEEHGIVHIQSAY